MIKVLDRLMLSPILNGTLAAFDWFVLSGIRIGWLWWWTLAAGIWFTFWFLATLYRSVVRYRRGWDPFGVGTEPRDR